MKLAFVTQHYPPHFEGGAEIVLRAQVRELAALGHDVRVVSGTDHPHVGQDVEHAEVDGLPVLLVPRHESEFYDLLLERPRVRGLVRELVHDVDLVHVHHWLTLDRETARTLAREHPVVITLHDFFTICPRVFRVPVHGVRRCPEPGDWEPCVRCCGPDVPTIPRASLHQGFHDRHEHYQAELDAAATVVLPSHSHLTQLRRFLVLPDERVQVVPHGLCRPLEGSAVRPFDGERLRIVFFGHRSHVKGLVDVVRGLAALPADLVGRVELALLGEEVEAGHDDALRAAAGPVALTFLGPYDHAELAARLAAAGGAHLATLPSRAYESYGLVVDEALALGLPMWVSDRGAPRERIGAAGRVLAAEDPGAWTRAVQGLFLRPEELAAERAAVPRVVRTAADAARELEARYDELVGATR